MEVVFHRLNMLNFHLITFCFTLLSYTSFLKGSTEDDKEKLVYHWLLTHLDGQRGSFAMLAKWVKHSGNELHLRGLEPISQAMDARCVVARKTGNGQRYYSRKLPVYQSCEPSKS